MTHLAFLTFILLIGPLLTPALPDNDTQVDAARGLIHRLLNNATVESLFDLAIEPNDKDRFELWSTDDGRIAIRGTTGVSLAVGFHHYLKYFANASVGWGGDQLDNVKIPLPAVAGHVTMSSPFRYRHHFNVCTFGYSSAFWDWDRWQRELDIMALWGVNMPLAELGQEGVWLRVFEGLGLNGTEIQSTFFSGPAFLPWNRMANLDAWGGPLPTSWMEEQEQLQIQVLRRERAFGMTPVLPGFAGHVPQSITEKYPDAKVGRILHTTLTRQVSQLSNWGGFNGTHFLDPTDPLFVTIGEAFINELVATFGTDHLYLADPFNEESPASTDLTWLANVGRNILGSMQQGDPDAIWIAQGWFLHQSYWSQHLERGKAMITAVPADKVVLLDLNSEKAPVWNLTDSFWGRSFVWCMLCNFGGRPGLYGMLDEVNSGPPSTLARTEHIVGTGMTPEALETNPMMYEFMAETAWRTSAVDVDGWIKAYATRRYGVVIPEAQEAWLILRNSVYRAPTTFSNAAGSIVGARPARIITSVGGSPTKLYYDPKDVMQAWSLLISPVGELVGHTDTYKRDIVTVTNQALSNIMTDWHTQLVLAFEIDDRAAVDAIGTSMVGLCYDMDMLVSAHSEFLFGVWLDRARAKGTTRAESAQYELNAALQVTTWSKTGSHLEGYAYKLWGGLVRNYYAVRWQKFVDAMRDCLIHGGIFDEPKFEKDLLAWEEAWIAGSHDYPTKPVGDVVAIASELFEKYGRDK